MIVCSLSANDNDYDDNGSMDFGKYTLENTRLGISPVCTRVNVSHVLECMGHYLEQPNSEQWTFIAISLASVSGV